MDDHDTVVINSLPLPLKIQLLIDRNEWTFPSDTASAQDLFTEKPTAQATLYSLSSMRSETEAWITAPPEELQYYGGAGASVGTFHQVDPRLTVLIGDLGYDMPIALDYSTSINRPRVVYLPSRAPGWIEIAPDVESFLDALGVNPTDDGVSPRVLNLSWGIMEVQSLGTGKDFKLYPGGGREWDWAETGTRHEPGIQPSDVYELVDHHCQVVVLSRGMERRLHTMPETLVHLRERGIEVHVEETGAAVELYNRLAENRRVGGLFHSTC
jgi:hypothetical protein